MLYLNFLIPAIYLGIKSLLNLSSYSLKKVEADLAAAQAELYEVGAEIASNEDKAKKAIAESLKLTEDLKREKENAGAAERKASSLDVIVKDLQSRLERAEEDGRKIGKRVSQKLEEKIHELEGELEWNSVYVDFIF